jgi:hypothetical protein
MADPIETRLIDKRVAHRYVRKGTLDEKEYEKYLKSLPDLADQALTVEASIEGEEPDGAPEQIPAAPAPVPQQ